ncbi:hypothetical protein D9615_002045 [Tricholomella constricta]|uniref:Cytochrome P450 n=1 Tax=Tricholomella constricta TaxID=117010 RepID=A0A8H5HP35_9AGAR|nr:hypothetical protein D9615_002045 [Tricholomella constricta]
MYAGIIVSFLFVGLLFILQYLRIRYLHGITIHRTIPTIHRLFSPPNSTAQDLLAARAVPNTRLILAFALTNTFVSDNIDIHATFVGSATLLLKAATERGWPHFQQVAIDAVDAALLGGGQLSFDVLVQDVTMRVALIGLLGVDTAISELDSRDICMVATLITTLWSLSKKPDHIPPDLLLLLNRHLRRLIPDEQAYPNPLDYLIPVWETLWRVVAVTVAYADKHCYGDKVFAELQRLPTITQFRAFGDSLPSVEWFITEAMRLHPPSKHIARSFVRPSASTSTLPLFFQTLLTKAIGPLVHRECADIETVLRSEDIWGADADKFDPLRYRPSRVTQEQERIKWLAFGHGRYRCVAAAWAPMAAGIISAAILDRLKVGSDLRLVEGDCVGAREGWRGWYLSRN